MSTEHSRDTNVLDEDEEQEARLEPPGKFRVILLNDDYTPMDFVVIVLKHIFHLDNSAANLVMLTVHEKGKGVAGVYTHEIAEIKQAQCEQMARKAGHPLLTVLEKE